MLTHTTTTALVADFKRVSAIALYVRSPWIDRALAERAAKEWANAHGYFGATGGWISKGESQAAVTAGGGRSVTQGWFNLWTLKRRQIEDYYTSLHTAFGTFDAMVHPESPTYRPTLLVLGPKDWRIAFLANAYDVAMGKQGDRRRAFTGS